MSEIISKFVKTYDSPPSIDRAETARPSFRHTTLVRHEGTVIAFAMTSEQVIYYSVLDLQRGGVSEPFDVLFWDEQPKQLRFTDELSQVGYRAAGQKRMPLVHKNGREVASDAILSEDERDLFLSTTARLTADARFQVLSDGQYIYLFRQAIDRSHARMVWLKNQPGQPGQPVVDGTLLVDRFVFDGSTLQPLMEVRYQRRRSKDIPLSRKDSLDYVDMDGNPFYEPTQELRFVSNLEGGRFAVLLCPSSNPDIQRWQIFSHNNKTQRLDCFSIERAEDGLFNLQGTRYYTSPEPRHQGDVFERAPGTCPFTGQPLIPLEESAGYAGTGLSLDGAAAYVDLDKPAALSLAPGPFTLEAWIRPTVHGRAILSKWNGSGKSAYRLALAADGKLTLENGAGAAALSGKQIVAKNAWTHVAATFDGANATLLVNGQIDGSAALAFPAPTDGSTKVLLGATYQSGKLAGYFGGQLDEVRIWDRARSAEEVVADMRHRLTGSEAGLVGYWRCDEGGGARIYDQTNNLLDGQLIGVKWAPSDAPVGENPGVRRSCVRLVGRQVCGGLSALLYAQAETAVLGYGSGGAEPIKRASRVLCAFPTRAADGPPTLAVLDLGLDRSGRPAQLLELVELPLLSQGSVLRNQLLDELARLEQSLPILEQEYRSKLQAVAGIFPVNNALLFSMWVESVCYGVPLELVMRSPRGPSRIHMSRLPGPAREELQKLRDRILAGEKDVVLPWQNVEARYDIYYRSNLALQWQFIEARPDLFRPELACYSLDQDCGVPAEQSARLSAERDAALVALRAAESQLEDYRAMTLRGEVLLPMPTIGIDPTGLTVAGALLDFVQTQDAPYLHDCADGRVALYFKGLGGELFAAYYNVLTDRAHYALDQEGGSVKLIAQSAGPHADGAAIAVVNGVNAEVCNVTLSCAGSGASETFKDVPRAADRFGQVLNGIFEPLYLGRLRLAVNGAVDKLALVEGCRGKLWDGAALRIGAAVVCVRGSVASGALELPIQKATLKCDADAAVYLFYDYDKLTSSTLRATGIGKGSRLFAVDTTGLRAAVKNGSATAGPRTPACQWYSDSPGNSIRWNGQVAVRSSTEVKAEFHRSTDFSIEVWAKPDKVDGRIVQLPQAMVAVRATKQGLCPYVSTLTGSYTAGPCLTPGAWVHLALSYVQGFSLQLDGVEAAVHCGSSANLDLTGELTLEVTAKLGPGRAHGLLTKGRLGRGGGERVPYSLYVQADGRVCFAFEERGGTVVVVTSSKAIAWNQVQRIGVSRLPRSEVKTRGTGASLAFDGIDSFDVFTFYCNGQRLGDPVLRFEKPASGSGALELGVACTDGRTPSFMQGELMEARVWARALADGEIGKAVQGGEKGLVAWWQLTEGRGNLTKDSQGECAGTLKGGARWQESSSPEASRLVLYVNGVATPLPLTGAPHAALATPQCCVGGAASGKEDLFRGELEELRIFAVARSAEAIRDTMFTRLHGSSEPLIAYYDFDKPAVGTDLEDRSPRRLHLSLKQDPYILSTAPISADAAIVRSALSGVQTAFHVSISGSPAAAEYGALSTDDTGATCGVLKRCFSYIRDGRWHLATGFKVGELVTQWLGQAQYDPQIIGFIEGAPPIPSENFTHLGKEDDYNGCSAIELGVADSTVFSASTSREGSFATAIQFKAAAGLKSQTQAGFVLTTDVENTELKVGGQFSFESERGWSTENSVSAGNTLTRASKLAAVGNFEPEGRAQNGALGRRWVPRNVGMAVVKSETADVFALRLKHSGDMVSMMLRPNPKIPKDWNILTFPMNPRYVRAGCLDGRVGFGKEANYPHASDDCTDLSYFKPVEAYALKRRIERKTEELALQYDKFSGHNPLQGSGPRFGKRDICNTYVWTADGGLFAETTETIDVVSESVGSSFQFKMMGGLWMEWQVALSKAAFFGELNVLAGGGMSTAVSKTRESSTSFRLSVDLNIERDIMKRDTAGKVVFDLRDAINPLPLKEPGKVDAYRFMSFYLQPDRNHFLDFQNKVIDRRWLEQSRDPNATALRQALACKTGMPWRILHRVTYVSRVLSSDKPAAGETTLEDKLRSANISSNYELIKQLEPYVAGRTASMAEFDEAVRTAVSARLPELSGSLPDIIRYMQLYFGILD